MTITKELVLVLLFYTPFTIQDDKHPVICSIFGKYMSSGDVLNIKELPEFCNIFVARYYCFDCMNQPSIYLNESDEGIIRKIVESQKTIYAYVGFKSNNDIWMENIFNPSNENEFQTLILDPLIKFTNTFNISGIIINCPPIYYDNYIEGFAKLLSSFVTKLKNKAKNLKVGFIFYGYQYENFSNKTILDFTITNDVLDLYIISWNELNFCYKQYLKTGVYPITSTNPDLITLEQVTNGIFNSTMDKLKIYADVTISALIPKENLTKNDVLNFKTYTEYCKSIDPATNKSAELCTNPSKLSYDQGAYAKKIYAGIMLDGLDGDDFSGTCDCEKFPVSKLIIDGWTGSEFVTCPKLDF